MFIVNNKKKRNNAEKEYIDMCDRIIREYFNFLEELENTDTERWLFLNSHGYYMPEIIRCVMFKGFGLPCMFNGVELMEALVEPCTRRLDKIVHFNKPRSQGEKENIAVSCTRGVLVAQQKAHEKLARGVKY